MLFVRRACTIPLTLTCHDRCGIHCTLLEQRYWNALEGRRAGFLGPSSAVSYAEGLGAQDLQLQAQNRGAHLNTLRCAPKTTGCARR